MGSVESRRRRWNECGGTQEGQLASTVILKGTGIPDTRDTDRRDVWKEQTDVPIEGGTGELGGRGHGGSGQGD